ncbi:MAG: hypothetical protein IJE43_07970 [Alphaproteobacteria bacterium]|nr:hypothetical protein [Alphaproteobacteria bacterium]
MPKNIFKIYDGRTNFWQWDVGQKLIVLDDSITEVHFSNRNMEHSKKKLVYTDKDGLRVCNVPDLLLQLPKNLIAYAYAKNGIEGKTVKSVKFAVIQRPIPTDYVCGQDDALEDIMIRLELLETLMKDVEAGKQQLIKFNSIVEAAKWAVESGVAGDIIIVKLADGWVPHIVEDNLSLSPICDCDGEMMTLVFDGDDADGHDKEDIEGDEEIVQYFDGGSAAGI